DRTQGLDFTRPGIGDQYVDTAMHPADVAEQLGQVGRVRNVRADGRGVLAEALNGFVELRLAAPGDNQLGTLAGERFSNGETEARRATSDQNNLIFKQHGNTSRADM